MSDSDSFIQEVTEELKRDRLLSLWRRYGLLVIGGIAVLVAAAGVMTWLEQERIAAAREIGGAMIEARRAEDPAAAFARIAEGAEAGPALVARLNEAAALAEAGEAEAAAEALDRIAADEAAAPIYREVAGFKAALLRAPGMTPEARVAALDPFAAEGAPLRLLAVEARAVAHAEAGDAAAARADLEALLADPNATSEMRQRVAGLAEALGMDAIPAAGDGA